MRSLARGYAAGGKKDKAQAIIKELERKPYVPSIYIAGIYGVLGNKEETFKWTQRAYRERDSVLADYIRGIGRGDPRITPLIRNMGLQP